MRLPDLSTGGEGRGRAAKEEGNGNEEGVVTLSCAVTLSSWLVSVMSGLPVAEAAPASA